MGPIRNIIWDFNGTLIDDIGLCVDTMNDLLSKRGLATLDIERYRQLFQFPVRQYYRILGFDFEQEPFEQLAAEYLSAYDAQVKYCDLYPGALDLLAEAKQQGLKQFVLSAFEHKGLVALLHQLGISSYFDDIMGLDNQRAASKVNQGIELMSKYDLEPCDTLIIGDTDHDLEVAQELGIQCILLDHGHQARQRLQALHPWISSDIALIPQLVNTMCDHGSL